MPVVSSRRLAVGALAGALMLGGSFERAAAQEGCVFGEEGNDVYETRSFPGGGTVTYVTRPHFLCDDGVQIWADSAVAYSQDALSHLIGRVRYLDGDRELTGDEARYFSNVGRLQAAGHVVVVDRTDGSRVENGDLVYLRETDFRDEESMTVTTGSDGLRPRATIPPPEPDSTVADSTAEPDSVATDAGRRSPYTVVGDRIVFRGSSYFSSAGDVEIERDSLFAFADSAEYVEASESLVLVGSARVEASEYVLVGRTITMGTDAEGTNEVRALRDAILTGEDLTLTAPLIKLYLVDGAVERLVAVPLLFDLVAERAARPDSATAPVSTMPDTASHAAVTGLEPDSADLARPVAVAEQFELTADSLELTAPGEVVDRIFAAGRARSVSQARDSLNVEVLPQLARQDWLEGDTIVIDLEPTRPESPPTDSLSAPSSLTSLDSASTSRGPAPSVGTDGGSEREYEIETIVARVGARSLYRLPPQDSTARAGVDLPAVHYVVGDEITIHMVEGEVEAMEVVGETRGIHLEPLGRPAAEADSLAADSLGLPDAAPPPDSTSAGTGSPGGRDRPSRPSQGDAAAVRPEPWRRP